MSVVNLSTVSVPTLSLAIGYICDTFDTLVYQTLYGTDSTWKRTVVKYLTRDLTASVLSSS
jgi:hypothetical protein